MNKMLPQEEREAIKELYKYYYFRPCEGFYELLSEYPEAPEAFYLFFNGEIERCKNYPELSMMFDSLHDYLQEE